MRPSECTLGQIFGNRIGFHQSCEIKLGIVFLNSKVVRFQNCKLKCTRQCVYVCNSIVFLIFTILPTSRKVGGPLHFFYFLFSQGKIGYHSPFFFVQKCSYRGVELCPRKGPSTKNFCSESRKLVNSESGI